MINLKEYGNREEVIRLLTECMFPNERRISQEYEKYMSDPTRIMLGRLKNEELIALIGITYLANEVIEIKHIAVKSTERRKGIGKELIMELINANKLMRLEAETDKNSVLFYRRIGFHISSLGEKYPGVERFKCIWE